MSGEVRWEERIEGGRDSSIIIKELEIETKKKKKKTFMKKRTANKHASKFHSKKKKRIKRE